jgi:hypothetical protein
MSDDEKINRIKHELPLLYKNDKESYKEQSSALIYLIKSKRVNPYLALDVVTTFVALCNNSVEWKGIINDVYDNFGINMKVELFKLLCTDIHPDEEENIIEKFRLLLSGCDNDKDIMDITFVLSTNFIKPTLLSKMRTLSIIPRNVVKVMGNEAFKKLESSSNKVKCLQRLIDVSVLSDEQLEYLLEKLDEPEYVNIVLDIFLRSEKWEYVSMAEKRLHCGQKRYFEVDNNVHYFEFVDTLYKIPISTSEEFTSVIIELIDIGRIIYLEIGKIYEFITFILNCSISYKDRTLKDIFCYVWKKAEEKERQNELVKSVHNDFVAICSRGFATNLIFFLKELGDETDYIVMNKIFIRKDEVLKYLRSIYDGDDNIWLDVEKLKSVIRSNYPNDELIEEVIKLIIG